MKITAIEIENIRCFNTLSKISLSKNINVFIGANNSGKSTILNIIYSLQKQIFNEGDVTIPVNHSHAKLFFEGGYKIDAKLNLSFSNFSWLEVRPKDVTQQLFGAILNPDREPTFIAFPRASNLEPDNLIYTYLSRRKAAPYSIHINEENTKAVTGDFSNLYAKIDRINNVHLEENQFYARACKEIFGFQITTVAKEQGKQAGYSLSAQRSIPLTSMGEGVANIVGLIADLCFAEDKIFLIEEPENDIHPKALKSLLKLIVEKSQNNQFIVSTHSNIVMKYLGSATDAKVFNVINDERIEGYDNWYKKLMLSRIDEIPNSPEVRRAILEELGYDFFDFDMWEAWLFLEESSAEVIINKLMYWFVPNLIGRLRTFSAGGTSKIADKFEDFNKLFVFLNLQKMYRNKVWVKLDGGKDEELIISEMKSCYSSGGWNDNSFSQFGEHDFEKYYPSQFSLEVERVLAIKDKKTKRNAKMELLDSVKVWIRNNDESAKTEFSKSAKEVVDYLLVIEAKLN